MRNLILLALVCFFIQSNAQKTIWTKTVTDDGFMNQLESGNILFKDDSELSLLDHKTGDALWSSSVKTEKNPKFFDGIPFMYFEGKNYAILDASTGEIIDQNESKTNVLDIHYFWEKSRIVVELEREKMHHVLNINLEDLSKSWSVEVGKVQKALFGLATRGSSNAPAIDAAGTIALVDKKHISYISPEGSVSNKTEFKKNIKKVGFNESKEILYVLEDKKNLHFINLKTAEIIHSLEVKEKDLKLKILNDENTVAIIQKKVCIMMDAISGDVIGQFESKDKIKEVFVDDSTGRYYLLLKKNVTELNTSDASVAQTADLDTDFQELYRSKDHVFLSGRGRINQIDLNDLSLKYSKAVQSPPPNDYIEMSDGRLYYYQIGPKFMMSFIGTDGERKWGKEYNSPRRVEIRVVNNDLLVINSTEVNFLSTKDGKSLWKKTVKVDPSFAYVDDEANGEYVFYSEKRVVKFDIDENSIIKSVDKFKFKDFDYETQQPLLLNTDNGTFLKGSNSVFFCSRSGTNASEKHYKKSDNTSGLLKLANTAVTVAAIGSGNADKVVTVYQNGEQVHKGSMVDDMNGSWAYANDAAAKRRAKQNSGSSSYPYVFTKLENKKRGLIFLDSNSAKERFDIVMDEKDPNYILDEIDGVIYYLSNTKLKAIDIK